MTLRLTPQKLVAAYDYLLQTEPFRGWRLPDSDRVAFHVVRDPNIRGDFHVRKGVPVIRISSASVGHSVTLLAVMAHEICHLRQHLQRHRDVHGPSFRRMAVRICKAHGFDLLSFC